MKDMKKKIIFLCTGNSCRSQMAEGFMLAEAGRDWEVLSAGVIAAGVHPRAIAVMKEIGIDISKQASDAIDPELLNKMDVIITLCGNAEAACPMTPPHIRRFHWPINDPVGSTGTEAEIMDKFRLARDEIGKRVREFIKAEKNS